MRVGLRPLAAVLALMTAVAVVFVLQACDRPPTLNECRTACGEDAACAAACEPTTLAECNLLSEEAHTRCCSRLINPDVDEGDLPFVFCGDVPNLPAGEACLAAGDRREADCEWRF